MPIAEECIASIEDLYELNHIDLINSLLEKGPFEAENGYDSAFHTPLWYFCRILRGHPELKEKGGKKALAVVEQVLRHRQQAWQDVFEVRSDEDARAEFLDVWNRIRFIPGEPPLLTALSKAQLNPIELPEEFEMTAHYRDFIGTAYYLQMAMGENRPIFLPEERLAELLECSPMTISRCRGWAKEHGLLRETKTHSFDCKSRKGKATEFLFNLERLASIQTNPKI